MSKRDHKREFPERTQGAPETIERPPQSPLNPEVTARFEIIRERITRALGEQNGSGPLKHAINPHLLTARSGGGQVKTYYAIMRALRENGAADMLDIGSSIEVDAKDREILHPIIESAHEESLAAGHHMMYPSSWGTLELRQSIAGFFEKMGVVNLDPHREVMVTAGIMKAIDALMRSLRITTVIVPTLSPSYLYSLIRLQGKQIIPAPLDLNTGVLNLRAVKKNLKRQKVRDGQALFYTTLPSAPAGTLPDEDFMEHEFIPFAHRHGFPVVSDTYATQTVFGNKKIRPLLSYPGAKDVGVEAITIAKEHGMPGVRVGGLAGNKDLINIMRLFGSSAYTMMPMHDQHLAAKVLNEMDTEHVGEKLKYELENEILPGFQTLNWPVKKPDAGLDLLVPIPPGFMGVKNPRDRTLCAALALLMEYGVGFSPVSECDTSESGKWLRVVIKQDDKKIPKALARLAEKGFDWRTYKPDPAFLESILKFQSEIDLTKL